MDFNNLTNAEIDTLYESFFKSLTEKMHPPQFRSRYNLLWAFWHDRFINVIIQRKEDNLHLEGYAEYVHIWIAGYKAAYHKIDQLRAIILA